MIHLFFLMALCSLAFPSMANPIANAEAKLIDSGRNSMLRRQAPDTLPDLQASKCDKKIRGNGSDNCISFSVGELGNQSYKQNAVCCPKRYFPIRSYINKHLDGMELTTKASKATIAIRCWNVFRLRAEFRTGLCRKKRAYRKRASSYNGMCFRLNIL